MFAPAQPPGFAWPHRAEARLQITLGDTLSLTLSTHNRGDNTLQLTQALHTYFHVGDIADIAVHGLDGACYHDAVQHGPAVRQLPTLSRQVGPVTFHGETDRVYGVRNNVVSIVDPNLGRRIEATSTGSGSTVVWNPWAQKAAALGDMAPASPPPGSTGRPAGGWRAMVCVETANTVYDPVPLQPDQRSALSVTYRTARL